MVVRLFARNCLEQNGFWLKSKKDGYMGLQTHYLIKFACRHNSI